MSDDDLFKELSDEDLTAMVKARMTWGVGDVVIKRAAAPLTVAERADLSGTHDGNVLGWIHRKRNAATAGEIEQPDSGFTRSVPDLEPVTEGYAVALAGSDRLSVAADSFVHGKPTQAIVTALTERVKTAMHTTVPGATMAVGGWHNPDDGLVEVNVTAVFPRGAEAQARAFAIANDQIAIYSLHDEDTINVGGTGGDERKKLTDLCVAHGQFACHDPSCRPPGSGGTGGSSPGGGGTGRQSRLSLTTVISAAEVVMEDNGLAGETIHVPPGHLFHNPDGPIAPLRARVEDIAHAAGFAGPINFYASDYELDRAGAQGMVKPDMYPPHLVVRSTTTELTILHEVAHLITGTAEGEGHDTAFAELLGSLYETHLGPEAAKVYRDIADIEHHKAGPSDTKLSS